MGLEPRRLYQYNSLLQDGYFRTLILQPGRDDEPLRCRLETSLIRETAFEAISYVWGSNVKDHEIICDGYMIPITLNLWTVLRHFRKDTPRVLWADSICINQEDLKEKSHQVGMMGHIFRSAVRVLIFLGTDDAGHGAHVRSLLDDRSTYIKDVLAHFDTYQNCFPFPADDAPILCDTRWESLNYMLQQSWFKRGWVVQEAALARVGRIFWGQYELNWEDLIRTYDWMFYRADALLAIVDVGLVAHDFLYLHYHEDIRQAFRPPAVNKNFLNILDTAVSLEFSDPRDRIFAFTELAQDFDHQFVVHPNYNDPFLQVYHCFAEQCVRSTKDSHLLDYVRHDEGSLQAAAPSWVPRWDLGLATLAPLRGRFDSPLEPRNLSAREPVFIDRSVLRVHGVIIDTVVSAIDTTYKKTTTIYEETFHLWEDIHLSDSKSPYAPPNRIDAFLEALACSYVLGEWSRWIKDKAAYILYLLETTNQMGRDDYARRKIEAHGGDMLAAVNFIDAMSPEDKFVLTERGYMGLAPHVTREGDICAIIFGCTRPCILRKTNQGHQYQLLGATHLLGKQLRDVEGGATSFVPLGKEKSKDWVEWDVEEQDIDLC